MAGSVTEMRLICSVVLMRSDLPTMTRKGADPAGCDCAGSVVVWVPVGPGVCGWAAGSACWSVSANSGRMKRLPISKAAARDERTFILGFLPYEKICRISVLPCARSNFFSSLGVAASIFGAFDRVHFLVPLVDLNIE